MYSISIKSITIKPAKSRSLICLETSLENFSVIKKIFLIGTAYPMQVNKSLLLKSKTDQDLAIKDMINWSLSDRIKLNGANLIGLNLPNYNIHKTILSGIKSIPVLYKLLASLIILHPLISKIKRLPQLIALN